MLSLKVFSFGRDSTGMLINYIINLVILEEF